MRLVFIIKSLSTPGGGAERVFVDVANGLYEQGHEVVVATFEPVSAAPFYPLNPSIPRIDLAPHARGKIGQLLILPTLRRKLKAFGPDVVVAFMPSAYVPVALGLALTGIPVLASEHNVPARYRKQPLRWLSILAASTLCPGITAVSDQMRQAYPRIVRDKMRVIPNPVSLQIGSQADVSAPSDKYRLLAVGRLHPQKDHITLVRAFGLLANEFPDWVLRILGDGSERARIASEIARLGLNDRIELPGTIQDMSKEYRAANLYVISSRYESLGLATLEALAHGLPAVGFADCPGTNEVIRNGSNGFLVDPGHDRAGALAEKLGALMRMPDTRRTFSISARHGASAHTLPLVLDQWSVNLHEIAQSR